MELAEIAVMLWQGLGMPLLRITFYISIGLMVANFIEALNWTHNMAKLAGPLIRVGHLSDVTGASFSMAFFSGVSANTMLAEGYDQGKINDRELILANLFNSLPSYFLHLPTVFFITVPLIKGAAFIYVGLTFAAAVGRTFFVVVLGRLFLPKKSGGNIERQLTANRVTGFRQALDKAWKRFKKRIRKVLYFTVPIYTLMFILHEIGFFAHLEGFIGEHIFFLSWLNPQSIGIIVLHVAAELTAGLAMAGALIDAGNLTYREVVLALLVGNVVSSPMRAVRHQFPYYAGVFPTKVAVRLIFYNQAFRVGSIIFVGIVYFVFTM